MRDSMIFYRSFYEAIKELPLEIQGEIYNALFSYGLDFKTPELSGISKTVWTLIKPQIDANIKRFENGNKPKNKQKGSEIEAKHEQKVSKTEANNNNNNNDNVNDNVNNNNKTIPSIDEFVAYAISLKQNVNVEDVKFKYNAWLENGWKKNKGKKLEPILNWKSTLSNTMQYFGEKQIVSNPYKITL